MRKTLLTLGSVFLTGLLAFAAEETIYQNDFNSPDSLKDWNEHHWHQPSSKKSACKSMEYCKDGGINNSGCLKFQADDPSCNFLYTLKLDPAKLHGRGVILEGWMKAENLTPPKINYLGPKLMLAVGTEQKKDHPDQQKEYGTYGWKKFSTFCRVVPTATVASVNLGIQGCTGKVWIDNVRVYLEPAPEKSNEKLIEQLPANKTAQYRGVMSGDDLSEESFRELRAVWNANLYRFQIGRPRGWDHTTEAGFRKIVDFRLKQLDAILPFARKYGIKIVIDMHVGPGTSLNALLSNQLSWDPAMQKLLVDIWREIAVKYKNEPMIYGYDLLNEPREENYVYSPNGGLSWNRLADKIAHAIREVDPKTPIIIEPHSWGGAAGLATFIPVNVPNVIYSIHCYNPGTYTHQGVMPSRPIGVKYPGTIDGIKYDRNELERGFLPAIEFQKKYNVPIYVGEFGVARWSPNGEQWLDDMISIFEKYGWDWTYHAYREWDGWSAEHSSDQKNTKRIGDTPRRRVLIRYMQKNPKMKNLPPSPKTEPVKPPSFPFIYMPDLAKARASGASSIKENGTVVLALEHSAKKSTWITFPIDTAKIAGKDVSLIADIRKENVSAPPNTWQGVKLMLTYTDANGKKNYPQADVKTGSADWQICALHKTIPQNIQKADIVLGMEEVSGKVQFRNVRIAETVKKDYSQYTLTGKTDHANAEYKPNEPMVFTFTIKRKDGKPAPGTVRLTRKGDDGKTETVIHNLKEGENAVYRTTSAQNGFVMVLAELLDDYGAPAKCNPRDAIRFGLGAGVGAATLKQGCAEPADFDAFWDKCKNELASVPMKVQERKLLKTTDISNIYDMKISCAGPRPVSGYLSIPKDAKQKSLPLILHYDGYNVRSAQIVESRTAINFFVNAHGVDNGYDWRYYSELGLGGYGFKSEENKKPETVYFKYMILRDLRALEYAKTLPEWDGKTVTLKGGSQGAFQSVAVAALSTDISKIEIAIPWFCDLGGITVGRLRGWRPDYQSALNYYDTVNFAKRVKCPVSMNAGLSDYVCPPSGTWILFNSFKVPVTAEFYQGLDHGIYPGFMHHTAVKLVYKK